MTNRRRLSSLAAPLLLSLLPAGCAPSAGETVDEHIGVTQQQDRATWSVTTVASGFDSPQGLAVDSAGNLYSGDDGSPSDVKQWARASGTITTLVSSGLNDPMGLAVDSSGNVYIADTNDDAVKEWVKATNTVTTLVGSGLAGPWGIAVDSSGNVYISDTYNHAVKKWDSVTREVTTLANSSSDGLWQPSGLALDASGNLYIVDGASNRVLMWSAVTQAVTTVVDSSFGLNVPFGVAVDSSGNLYITDMYNNAVKEWVRESNSMRTLVSGYYHPQGIALDSSGNVYFNDWASSSIFMASPPAAAPQTWDFGGAFGYVGGGLSPNPSTGAASCPAGYTATQVLSTSYVDWPVSFCAKPHQAGVDPVYDFGGMYGYVNGAQVANPITGASSCPAHYSDQEILGAANCDPYPLHVCYAPHVAGTTPAFRFGGMYGNVSGAPVPNPVTGAASCPAEYTDTQVLGTNGVDEPLHFCWYASSWDFGGAFGYVGGGLSPNPSTGAASCPAGYTATQVLSTSYVDWPVSFCARPHQAGVDPVYDFGGMYGYVNGAQVANPITGASSCPANYSAQEILGAANCDPYPLYVCYAPHAAGTGPAFGFGGMWGTVNYAPVANPVTGTPSCSPEYNDTQVLGTNGVDEPLHLCWDPSGAPAWDFGGAFGYVNGGQVPNPGTNAASCPSGYTATQVMGTNYVDWPMSFCARRHQQGVDPLYDFGGMYGYVNGGQVPNPLTGAASCPSGYTALELLGTPGTNLPLYVCYAPHHAGAGHAFGGMWGTVNGAPAPNPVTGAASCPTGYTDTQVLGTNGLDEPLHVCMY